MRHKMPINAGCLYNLNNILHSYTMEKYLKTRMWADAQRDGRPAEHRWRPLLNVAKFS